MRLWKRNILLAAVVLLLAGCNQKDSMKEAMNSAEKRVKLGDYKGAIEFYEGALDGTTKSADIYYKIGMLYDDKLKEPLHAIHHYDRYLEIAPEGGYIKEVKIARGDCERRLQARVTQGGFMTLSEGVRLKNENESLRKIIAELRSPKTPAAARVADPTAKDPLPPGSREHTVAKGDTLASIALKYYKSRAYASQIKDANFNQLEGKDIIKPGQVLIIPEIGKPKKTKK